MVPVPPLIAVTLAVVGAALAVRHIAKRWRQANVDLDAANDATLAESKNKPVPKLRRDPDGTFRP